MPLELRMTKGLPGSGKTRHSKNLQKENPGKYKRINKDDLRAMLDDSKYTKNNELFILNLRDILVNEAFSYKFSVIVDDTNLDPKHEDTLRNIALEYNAKFIIDDFTNIPVEECIKNDLNRLNSVGSKVIYNMYNRYLKPKSLIYYSNVNLPNVVICDLDGTLSLLNGRNPYDASTCDQDIINPVVQGLIKYHKVILVSGRSEEYRPQTLKFLKKYDVKFHKLFMRKTGDHRKDYIIKREIFEENIRPHYNVEYVLDDRNSVVEMWRSLGLTVLQVADGDF